MALEIRKVSKAALPARLATPGRVRRPSEFDDVIESAYEAWQADPDEAWFEVPYDGSEDEFNYMAAELNRSVVFFGIYGKSIRGGFDTEAGVSTKNGEGTPVFWFQVRDKLTTGPRKSRSKNGDGDGSEGEDDDVNMQEIEQSIEDAKSSSSKRGRKTQDPVMVDHGVD